MTIIWKPPSIPGACWFATLDGFTEFASVGDTAFPDGRWCAEIFPDGSSVPGMTAYAGSEVRAKQFVEEWAARHASRVRVRRNRQVMPHEGLKPRKPKGAEDRS